ncbi:hypothetical protein NDU88_005440 [Pleurodeles waltl]|uniref:Uncharacterized protein n=1 Tax=Pleurodeles waltl TaxID=8319 RepID=A0AAV7TB25_PLEWA|nr:hypothetical protein NDU88_005440 [Pleurodeles waltl]
MGNSNSSSEGFRQFSLENDMALDWKKGTKPTDTRKDSPGMQQQRQTLADTLETSFKPNQASKLTVEVEQEITKHYLEHPLETEAATIEECPSDETRSLVKNLKNDKAPGKDRITNQAIKMFPNAAVVRLAEIFNTCLQH